MTALIVVFAIILFFAFLMFMPITVYGEFENSVKLSVRYLFVKIRILPQKPKKKTQKKKEKKEKKETDKEKKPKQEDEKDALKTLKEALKKTGVSGFIEIITDLAKIVGSTAAGVIRHIVIKSFDAEVKSGGEDAAQTAINYGYISAALYPAASIILGGVKKYKSARVQIFPDYDSKSSSVKFSCVFRVKLWWIVLNALSALIKLIKELMKLKKQEII